MNIKLNSENQPFPFVPRSVLMALESQSAKTKDKKNKSAKKGRNSLEGSRGVLLKSIAGFLESNGFKKTLDMFISEAQIQENSWKSSAVNLDDIVSRFFDSSSGKEAVAIQCEKPQDNDNETEKKKRKSSNGNVDDSETPVEEGEEAKKERKEKKKKKKKKSNVDKSTPVKEEIEEPKEEIKEAKDEKKKKSKKQKEQLENKVEELKSSNDENKDEKKRKQKKEVKELNEIGDKEKENKGINHENDKEKSTVEQQNGENGENKVSKKRKKPDSEEENDYEANIGNDINAPVIENGNKEPKSGKKDKSSDEPKSANAFKRVKIEEVKFADQRLQDNSYWAKDGADSGYGAKAQQILEQVRGRDFRHEKTKKKRGSYRGGQIDLQSHSIKFNYSDEE